MAPATLCEAFQTTAAVDPDAVALRTPGSSQTLTWRQYADQVRQVAAGLAALGVGRGDTVALMMANRIEFYPLEVGAQHVGATSFSVYNTLSAEQLTYVFSNADTKLVICEEQYVDRVRASGVPITHLVCVDGSPEGTISVAELIAGGAPDFDFEATWRGVRPDDVATLIYTSGTTGNPKGVETTHANLIFEAEAVVKVLGVEHGDRITSYLPSAHIADRFTALYLQETYGTQITTIADATTLAAALPDVRPTIWGAVPRVWEKLKAGIEMAVDREPDEARKQGMQWALGVARKVGAAWGAGEPLSDELAAERAKAEQAVFGPLRAKVGLDQLKWAVSGAAPIPPETLGFFYGLGVPISELWGMSELSCIATLSAPADAKLGTVGPLLPGMEGRIAEDGELLVRGPLVMKGYRKEPEKTRDAIDADGWLHTGDVMTVDDEGHYTIVDRKKELIINAAGKNMSPANIENTIKAACPYVGSMVTIGDARPYNTALIVLDQETAAGYAAKRGLADASAKALAADPELIAQLKAGVAAGNAKLSRVEQLKRFRVLPAFWEPGGDEVTLTMKLKRRPISAKYAVEIEEMYADPPSAEVHESTAEPAPAQPG
ncbi:MAG: fatty acid--CoA ligase FadD11 [Micromonosporaceae bacterium]